MTHPSGGMCRICNQPTQFLWRARLLHDYVAYFECASCGYVQTETPYWLELAYSNSITLQDTGIMARNLLNSRITLGTLFLLGGFSWRVLDYAGGHGILVRLLRDDGIDAYWQDKYCSNLLARGFEHSGANAGLVTAFEALEHFAEPVKELENMFSIAPNVLVSTEIIPKPCPNIHTWWYYGSDHGQHIGFFRVSTLQKLAERFGKRLITNGTSYHLFCEHPISIPFWKLSLRFNRLIHTFARHRLISKTWTDHELLAKNRMPCE